MIPETIFGMFCVLKSSLEGSSLSGEYTRKKFLPISKPKELILGRSSSSVVPGYVVLSKDIT